MAHTHDMSNVALMGDPIPVEVASRHLGIEIGRRAMYTTTEKKLWDYYTGKQMWYKPNSDMHPDRSATKGVQ